MSLKLREKEIYPTDQTLKEILGESFISFEMLRDLLFEREITFDWNYYEDGKAWLCKLLFRSKRNLAWLHVYGSYFIITCYFMARHLTKIEKELDISPNIKENFFKTKPIGRLISMPLKITSNELPEDILNIVLFKIKLK